MKLRSALSLLLPITAFVLAAAPAQAKLVGFQTPDKSVGCYLGGQGAAATSEIKNGWPRRRQRAASSTTASG